MKRAPFLIVPALAMIAVLPAAEGAAAPLLSNSPTRKLPLVVDDLGQVASAHLYVTSDGGTTWNVAQELVPVAGETPRFSFTAPTDGLYGFASAVTFKDGHREPEPRPGQVPQLLIQIDTTPPTVERFSARVESLVGGNVNVRLAWAVNDAIQAEQPATIEISADGGTTFAPLQRGPAQGNLLASVPAPTTGQRLAVRLRGEDKAGNLTLSAVTSLDTTSAPAPAPAAVPAPATGDATALAAALAALPSLDQKQVPAPASAPAPPVSTAPTAGPLAPAEAPPVTTTRPEIVEPHKPIPPPLVEVETVRGNGMDQEYRQARAAQEGGHQPAWQETKDRSSHLDVAPSEPTNDRPAGPKLPAGIPPVGSLTPSQAQSLLVQARESHIAGDDVTALAYYRRLRGSSIASQAILDEVRLLRQANRVAEGLAVVAGLPAAQVDDNLRIEHGRLLIAAGRAHDALTPLTGVRSGTAQSDEALYVIAQALAADGKADQAKKVYAVLAKGTGPWAQAAQQQLTGR